MITVTTKKGTTHYSDIAWNLSWFLMWLSGVLVGIAACSVAKAQERQTIEVNTQIENGVRVPIYKHLNIPMPDTYKRLDTSYAIIVYVVERGGSPLDLKADYGMVIDTLIREDWVPDVGSGATMNAVQHADVKSHTLVGVPIYEQYKIIAGNKAVPLDMVVAIIPKQKPKK